MSPALRLRPFGKKLILGCAAAALQAMLSGDAQAQSPTAEQALQLMPVQKDVEFDRPTKEEIAKCTIKVEKEGAVSGWVVFDPAGQTIPDVLRHSAAASSFPASLPRRRPRSVPVRCGQAPRPG